MAAKLQVLYQHGMEKPLSPEKQTPHAAMGDDHSKNIHQIVKGLYRAIQYYAQLKDFTTAERLREKLIKIAPTATHEIFQSFEIIEKEKIAAMDLEKIKPWAELFNSFTPGEAAAFYFGLKSTLAKPNQRIFKQGECDDRLFFIESGMLKQSYFDSQDKKNVTLATLQKGDVCGAEAFFTSMPHTTSLIALENSQISFLEKKTYQHIKTGYPAIDPKLMLFCEKNQKKVQHRNIQMIERRAHERHAVTLKAALQRMDAQGRPLPPVIPATVSDISVGGMCVTVPNMGIGTAANFHQSSVRVTLSYEKHFLTYELTKEAKVVHVRMLPLGDCCLHLQFATPVDESKILEIATQTNITAYL